MPKLPFDMLVESQLLADDLEVRVHPKAILIIRGDDLAKLDNGERNPLRQFLVDSESLLQLTLDEAYLLDNVPAAEKWLIISVDLLDALEHIFESWPLTGGVIDQVQGDKLDGDLSVSFAVGTYLELGATIVLNKLF